MVQYRQCILEVHMSTHTVLRSTWLLILALSSTLLANSKEVTFGQSSASEEAYDFVEVTANVAGPDVHNPFTDATLLGSFGKTGATERTNVEGFCDSADGSIFRIRFMPSKPGEYSYSIAYRQGAFEKTYTGTFRA